MSVRKESPVNNSGDEDGESAVGMQLRSKASPADFITQSATLHRTEWAVPNAVSQEAGAPC